MRIEILAQKPGTNQAILHLTVSDTKELPALSSTVDIYEIQEGSTATYTGNIEEYPVFFELCLGTDGYWYPDFNGFMFEVQPILPGDSENPEEPLE